MSSRRVFVYGASGHGKVVGDILLALKEGDFVGFIDDRTETHGRKVLGLPVFGNGEWLELQAKKGLVAVALGVGDNLARRRLTEKCLAWGAELMTLVHPTVSVSTSAYLGAGTVVMAHATINPDAKTGTGVIVNTAAVVEHDCDIGDFAHVAPNAVMGGASRLGTLSQLGIGAVVIQCVHIGANTIIGAGAVVVRDIPDRVVAVGVPARIHRNLEFAQEQHDNKH